MLSDVSDLTELSSDEEVFVKSKPKALRKSRHGEFQINQSLRPPRTSQYSAKALYDNIAEGTIDLDPEYQRDVVWPESKQTGLIDSILHNYYVPPIIFAVSATDDGYERRTCIDGKQRLTSIQRFMDGLIPHKDSFTNQKMWYSTNGVPNRKLLPPQYRKIFANKQIVCVEYENLTGDQEREIFQRVQLGVALTPAERMQAITGPWPSLIREVLSQVLGDDGFDGYFEWGRGRGRDFHCLTSIAYLMDKYPRHTNPTVVQLEKWLQDTRPVPAKFRDNLFETFRIFVLLARDQNLSKCFQSPRVSPVEFVMIGLLIHVHCMTLSHTQISSAIEKLRADVRANYADIRMNTKVMKHMFDFVTKRIKFSGLKSDGKGDTPATLKRQPAPPKSTKRKRAALVDSDDEGDVKPPPAKAKSSSGKTPKASTSQPKISSHSKATTAPAGNPREVRGTLASSSAPRPTPTFKATTSKSPPIPTRAMTPRIPRISTLLTLASIPGPTTAPVMPPPSAPAPASTRALSSPPIQTLPPAAPSPPMPPPVIVKAEPRAFPLTSSQGLPPNQGPSSNQELSSKPGTSGTSPADRLAPLRAAKAAVKLDSPTVPSPLSEFRAPMMLGSLATHDPQHSPSHLTSNPQPQATQPPVFPAGIELTQVNLDQLLLKAGYQPQKLLPAPSPTTPVQSPLQQSAGNSPNCNGGSSDMSISPQSAPAPQAAPADAQPQAPGPGPQETLPVKPPSSNANSRRASGESAAPGQGPPPPSTPRPFQTASRSILLAVPMAESNPANATTSPPPPLQPAATELHPRGSQPPAPSPASSSSGSPHLPPAVSPAAALPPWQHDRRTADVEMGSHQGGCDKSRDPRSESYGEKDTRERERDWDRGRDRGRDGDPGNRRNNWERRDWERDRGWGYPPGNRHGRAYLG